MGMETSTGCITCHKTKAPLQCGLCQSALCKNCTQFVDEESFSFLKTVPPELSHTTYCAPCFDATVAPELESYADAMERAKDIFIFYKTEGKETRLIKRKEEPYVIAECLDKNETLLRLAFFAVKDHFNALVDVEIKSEKVRSGSYQTLKWSGSAVPFQVDERKQTRK